jgi:hypothetical protein
VHERDVAGADQRADLGGVAPHDSLVVPSLGRTQLASVAGGAVEPVVDALGDREEGRIALDDQPARIDARASDVRQQRLQHLRHAAAGRGRVNVQHGPAGEHSLGGLGDLLEARHPVQPDQRLEARRVESLYLDLLKPCGVRSDHHVLPPHSVTASAGRGACSSARSKNATTRRSYSRGRASSAPVWPAPGTSQSAFGAPAAA